MAKKKTSATTKTKKSAPAKSATSKTTRKPASKKKAVPKKPTTRPVKTKAPVAKSVDGILKQFEKERSSQNSRLSATRKKIEQLTKKIKSEKAELEKLKKLAVDTEIAIDTLDSRRDKEVGRLLTGMGIDLGKAAAAAKPKATEDLGTPLFDNDKSEQGEKKADS